MYTATKSVREGGYGAQVKRRLGHKLRHEVASKGGGGGDLVRMIVLRAVYQTPIQDRTFTLTCLRL